MTMYGFTVFSTLPPGRPVHEAKLDWRPSGGALPAHSTPLLAEDAEGKSVELHGYPQGWEFAGQTIAAVATAARLELAEWEGR